MRIVNGILCILLLLFAVVQYNDPDGLYWGPIYLIGALWTGIASFRPSLFTSPIAAGLFALSLAAMLFGVWYHWPQTPDFWKQDVWWETETAREGMGMMITAVALLVAGTIVLRIRRS